MEKKNIFTYSVIAEKKIGQINLKKKFSSGIKLIDMDFFLPLIT